MKVTDLNEIQQVINLVLDNYWQENQTELPTDDVLSRTQLRNLLIIFYLQSGEVKACGNDYILNQAYAIGNTTDRLSWILDKHGMTCIIYDHKFKEYCNEDTPYFCLYESLRDDIENLLDAIQTTFINVIYM